ncbi:DUF2303 family protein [Brevundimonas balnearis]|uniref:DUF2303 family protein n=1 Tax=Brevundimonas balnearis TaxID=1572858 RepID=A0ABV6R0X3_9CAUL
MSAPETEAGVIAELAVRANGGEVVHGPNGRTFLVSAPGAVVKDITDPHGIVVDPPARIRQSVTLQTVDSLVDYVDRFKTKDTVLFADIRQSSIAALIDYHGPGEAAHVDHKATMILPFSEEWKTWTAIDGKMMDQLTFARFLEENAVDVVAPSGADLLEVCRDLQAKRKVDFRKAVRTNTDNENFEYTDETTATAKSGGVEVPSKFQLKVPVYFGGETVSLFAFLRWNLVETSLQLGVKLHRAEHVRQAVFKQIVTDAGARSERPVLFGTAG